MKLDPFVARRDRMARAVLTLLGAVLLAIGPLTLQACAERDRSKVDEAVEELKDEAEDAKEEIEDEVDDHT
jgi:hypothetical protein